jgi:hypothetical protein
VHYFYLLTAIGWIFLQSAADAGMVVRAKAGAKQVRRSEASRRRWVRMAGS